MDQRKTSELQLWVISRVSRSGFMVSRRGLNQIEIYFSIIQRKALTPNDFPDLAAVADRLLKFQNYYESIAKPFEWKFTRQDLQQLLSKVELAAA